MYILTLSHTPNIDIACRNVVSFISEKCKIINIDLSQLYGVDSLSHSSESYVSIEFILHCGRRNIWQTPLTQDETMLAMGDLWELLRKICSQYELKAAILADDQGCFEKLYILFCNLHNIPVIHWVHGASFEPLLATHHADLYPNNSKSFCIHNSISNVLPCGLNGQQFICVQSQLDKVKLLYHGVPAHQVMLTGNPSYDCLYSREKYVLKNKNQYKILYVSTGYLKFGMVNFSNDIYRFILEVIGVMDKGKFSLDIRLKPGEKLENSAGIYNKLCEHGIGFTDNRVLLEDQIMQYDAVIVDKSSACLQSVLLGIPTLLLKIPSVERAFPLQHLEVMQLLSVRKPHEINEKLSKALTQEYLVYQDNEIRNNESLIFHKTDGKAALRIARCIEKILRKEIAYEQYSILPAFQPQAKSFLRKIKSKILKLLRLN